MGGARVELATHFAWLVVLLVCPTTVPAPFSSSQSLPR